MTIIAYKTDAKNISWMRKADFADELRSDWVHFGEKAFEILADAVISSCEEMLWE